jgi:uncharacterized membrane protein HdeD (DUF308 family)
MTIPLQSLAKHLWWAVLLRGILAILFGVIALFAPTAALTGIVIVYGIYVLLDGTTAIAQGVLTRSTDKRWGWTVVQGVIAVLAGLVALVFPALSGTVGGLIVLWIIVVYAVLHGVTGVMSAAGASGSSGRSMGIVAGVVSIIAGVLLAALLIVIPEATVLGLIWIVGVYAIIFGVVLVVTAVQVRRGVTGSR